MIVFFVHNYAKDKFLVCYHFSFTSSLLFSSLLFKEANKTEYNEMIQRKTIMTHTKTTSNDVRT